ncbi:MAG: hypothetical protein GY765_27185 [bacterium]|nr:hypothetical protein [bacterium]
MKKLVLVICVLVFSFSMLSAGQYADVALEMEKMEKVFIEFEAATSTLASAADAAKAINGFKDGMEKLLPGFITLSAKYPNIKDLQDNPPAEIKAVADRIKKHGENMKTIFSTKLSPYMMDPAVTKAFQELGAAMMKYQAAAKNQKAPAK